MAIAMTVEQPRPNEAPALMLVQRTECKACGQLFSGFHDSYKCVVHRRSDERWFDNERRDL